MGIKEFFHKRSLRQKDNVRTNAAELTLKESLFPIILVTILFFLWGFSYGLLDTLNKHFQDTLHITRARSSGLQAAYFGAYLIASLGHAAWILRHWGYKATFVFGLFLYGLGALIAIPCIIAKSFGGFCAAIFIIGNGLGSLETAANPYITVCGPPKYSEIRINISQAFNGIGTVVAPVMGSYVFFAFDDKRALENVQWVYLSIAIFVWGLAIVFWLARIPEITDADMAFQASETHANVDDKPFRKQYRLFHASFAQFCYTGAQVAIAGFFINYVTERRENTDNALGSKLLAGAQAAFAIGRFAGVGVMHYIKPRWVFLAFLSSCIIFIAPSITQKGDTGMAMLYIVLFFESICFPTIVALGMRGLGRHSKRGSGFIVAGVSGGAVVPPLLGVVADHKGMGIAMVIPLIFFVLAWSYALAVNFVPRYRNIADAFSETEVGIRPVDVEEEKGGIESVEDKRDKNAIPTVA
ncbi:glucose/galactose transporter [Colletotrichum scovillei]|uniref:Glucose/galactose transporter n=1 Tax=Colletotrichum scovillei TaxID=1209932 RepID=A0A9P7QQ60_9PEZI|nr:glucose/galactose transporter [Colletotrichum scovillei]KAF4776578.1 glucose/galactose transporter [Colletotrichum scovillei]KAG7038165.1 glucose/galactose transporter [Colletotrichum scovillei]KAG7040508.1 glucose/galactose transporter [Colletotrichum scovillei]KAG7060556.1 glucose/galactose transporter [Colletotrichum scovillei]